MRNWRKPHSPVVGTWQKEDLRQAESRRTRIPRKGRAKQQPELAFSSVLKHSEVFWGCSGVVLGFEALVKHPETGHGPF